MNMVTPKDVIYDLIQLGLQPYKARVLNALVGTDEGLDTVTIAERAQVPRTSVYKTAQELVVMGLVYKVPNHSSMQWAADSWDDTIQNLRELAAGRLAEDLRKIDTLKSHVL